MLVLLCLAAGFLAYANGANDNFKGVASLYGSGTLGYRPALGWATVTTLAGSVASVFLAEALLNRFSGKGIVPDAVIAAPSFLLAVALGAGLTVLLATRLGFPISTTHGLTGAIVGSGLAAVGLGVNAGALGTAFVLPLLLSPLLAVGLGGGVYLAFRLARLRLGVTKEWCVCVGREERLVPVLEAGTLFASPPLVPLDLMPTVSAGPEATCTQRYAGSFLGIRAQRLADAAHVLSAGAVSFARGLNDTPKIAALLLVVRVLDIRLGMVGIAVAMAVGGLLGARRVAETMSHKITSLTHGQGLAANLATAALVLGASRYGLPVSTTHVSVGALTGIGLTARTADLRVVGSILLSWVITLPCAALLAALAYTLLSAF